MLPLSFFGGQEGIPAVFRCFKKNRPKTELLFQAFFFVAASGKERHRQGSLGQLWADHGLLKQ